MQIAVLNAVTLNGKKSVYVSLSGIPVLKASPGVAGSQAQSLRATFFFFLLSLLYSLHQLLPSQEQYPGKQR